jgi:hypothetical protein
MKRSEENGRMDDDKSNQSPPRNRPRLSDNINGASHSQLISSSPQQQMDDDDHPGNTNGASQSHFCDPLQIFLRGSTPPDSDFVPSTPSYLSSSSPSPQSRPSPLEQTNFAPVFERPSYTSPLLRFSPSHFLQLKLLLEEGPPPGVGAFVNWKEDMKTLIRKLELSTMNDESPSQLSQPSRVPQPASLNDS